MIEINTIPGSDNLSYDCRAYIAVDGILANAMTVLIRDCGKSGNG